MDTRSQNKLPPFAIWEDEAEEFLQSINNGNWEKLYAWLHEEGLEIFTAKQNIFYKNESEIYRAEHNGEIDFLFLLTQKTKGFEGLKENFLRRFPLYKEQSNFEKAYVKFINNCLHERHHKFLELQAKIENEIYKENLDELDVSGKTRRLLNLYYREKNQTKITDEIFLRDLDTYIEILNWKLDITSRRRSVDSLKPGQSSEMRTFKKEQPTAPDDAVRLADIFGKALDSPNDAAGVSTNHYCSSGPTVFARQRALSEDSGRQASSGAHPSLLPRTLNRN